MAYTNVNTASTQKRIFIAVLNTITIAVILAVSSIKTSHSLFLSWQSLIALLIYYIANYIILVKLYGGTLFHILFHLRIINTNGKHGLTWLQSLKRFLSMQIAPFIINIIPYAFLFLNKDRRHLGDLWANTRVIDLNKERQKPTVIHRSLFLTFIFLGILITVLQVLWWSRASIGSEGLSLSLPSWQSQKQEWNTNLKLAFVNYCTEFSSEYLNIAVQGQGIDEELMAKFTSSIQAICNCVASEMEKNGYTDLLSSLQDKQTFESLFENEQFTIEYVKASATCESSFK